jgi:hypothetical protein
MPPVGPTIVVSMLTYMYMYMYTYICLYNILHYNVSMLYYYSIPGEAESSACSIRQHTSAYVSIRQSRARQSRPPAAYVQSRPPAAYVSKANEPSPMVAAATYACV